MASPLYACRACRCLFIGAAACPLCKARDHVVPHTEWFPREATVPGTGPTAPPEPLFEERLERPAFEP